MTLRALQRALRRAGKISVEGRSILRHAGCSIGSRVVAVGDLDSGAVLFADRRRTEAMTPAFGIAIEVSP